MRVDTRGRADKHARLVLREAAVTDDAAEVLVGILHSVERDAVATHAVAEEEHGTFGVLGDGAVDHDVGVVQNLIPVGVVRAFALALAVAAVVEAIRADAGLVQLLGHVVIAALVLAQTVHYDAYGPVVCGDLWVVEEPRAVERGDELVVCHGWPPCGRVRGSRAEASCALGVGGA